MHSPVRIVAICGSLRAESYTRMALNIALRAAKQTGVDVELLDLRDYKLIFCGSNVDTCGNETDYPADVMRLRNQVKQAHGIILGTPEYHSSFSGVLKNALDLMACEQFEGKMIGLVGVSAGAQGANTAINALRSVGRSLHAWVVPEQVSIPFVEGVFDAQGEILNRDIEARLAALGQQVARFASLHSSTQAQAFIEAWEAAPQNPAV
ncbi:MAG TPA: NADPH-dependent oxidoreductase [Gammaproteobacteria bacterium]|nr:NADPH-dependent oxidoreductase [Gammaproteobacteria bacterium]